MSGGGRRSWRPTLGAILEPGGCRFRVWAPERARVDVLIDPLAGARRTAALEPQADGTHTTLVDGVRAGDRYAYALDGDGPYPDPASRAQPDGVHAASIVVDPQAFAWRDAGWTGVPLERAIIYELHVGTFTPAGTFRGVVDRLKHLADLGVTVVELMPVADFPGARNWGYDGVSLFAPARCYGTPDDLRALVDAAHAHGLAVMLDVVYNHFGPDGAYFTTFSPNYVSTRHHSPWGAAVNLDDDRAGHVRALFIENALHWVHEYHVDGLRLDAVHGLIDDRPRHFVQELVETVRGSITERELLLIAEDERNLRTLVLPPGDGGWGLDAVWADDFHHQVRRHTAGDTDGYYADYSGTTADLAETLRAGWFYRGQHSSYLDRPRGTDPAGIPLTRMVICIQNHDQVGNRPFGRRLNHQVDEAVYRAASALLLFAPQTPLLFMGQEWAASARFLFFTDHHPELGMLVTQGRRAEFSRFTAFADEATRAEIPDPQADATFEASRLRWDDLDRRPHAGMHALYRALVALRRGEPALQSAEGFECAAVGEEGLVLVRGRERTARLMLVVRLGGAGAIDPGAVRFAEGRWRPVLTTEDAPFVAPADNGRRATIELDATKTAPVALFERPGAVVLREVGIEVPEMPEGAEGA